MWRATGSSRLRRIRRSPGVRACSAGRPTPRSPCCASAPTGAWRGLQAIARVHEEGRHKPVDARDALLRAFEDTPDDKVLRDDTAKTGISGLASSDVAIIERLFGDRQLQFPHRRSEGLLHRRQYFATGATGTADRSLRAGIG